MNYRPGQDIRDIKSRDLNRFDEAADVVLGQPLAQPGDRPISSSRDRELVRNDVGVFLSAFSVVGIAAPIVLPADNLTEFKYRPALSAVVPTSSHEDGGFAVIQSPLAAGAIARTAVAAGVTPVRVYVNDAAHLFADAAAGDTTQLHSAATGPARILWKESGTGTRWALVRIGVCCDQSAPGGCIANAIIIRTPTGGIPARSGATPGSAVCTVYQINAAIHLTPATPARTETVYNICDVPVAGDTYGKAERDEESCKYIIDLECPVSVYSS